MPYHSVNKKNNPKPSAEEKKSIDPCIDNDEALIKKFFYDSDTQQLAHVNYPLQVHNTHSGLNQLHELFVPHDEMTISRPLANRAIQIYTWFNVFNEKTSSNTPNENNHKLSNDIHETVSNTAQATIDLSCNEAHVAYTAQNTTSPAQTRTAYASTLFPQKPPKQQKPNIESPFLAATYCGL